MLQSKVALKGISEKSLNMECDANVVDINSSVMTLPKSLGGWSLLLRQVCVQLPLRPCQKCNVLSATCLPCFRDLMSTCDDGEEMRLEAGAGTHVLLHEDHETSFSRR